MERSQHVRSEALHHFQRGRGRAIWAALQLARRSDNEGKLLVKVGDVLEQMMFLIDSLESPYQIFSNAEPVTRDKVGLSYKRLNVWTNDRTNADFLLLMSELGVKVHRTHG